MARSVRPSTSSKVGNSSVRRPLRLTSMRNISAKNAVRSRSIGARLHLNSGEEKYSQNSSPCSGAPSAFDAPAPRKIAVSIILVPLLEVHSRQFLRYGVCAGNERKANVYHPGEHDRIAAQQGVVSPDIVDSELLERCEEKGGVREIEKLERDRAPLVAENAVE